MRMSIVVLALLFGCGAPSERRPEWEGGFNQLVEGLDGVVAPALLEELRRRYGNAADDLEQTLAEQRALIEQLQAEVEACKSRE